MLPGKEHKKEEIKNEEYKKERLKSILVVDDDPATLRFIQEVLRAQFKIFAATSGELALQFLLTRTPDLMLLDVEMPGMDGYQVIKAMKRDYRMVDIPVIFLTSHVSNENEEKAFSLGAMDFINKPASAGVVRSRVNLNLELLEYRLNLEKLVESKIHQLEKNQNAILDILANITAFRDNETGAHIKRTTDYADILVNNLLKLRHPSYTITPEYASYTVRSAKLHDIGKVSVPDNILLKNGKLDREEFDKIKLHTRYGGLMMDFAIEDLGDDSSFLLVAREIVVWHHEWWNGKGYPDGLKGEEIPVSARIMGIADVYDALISKRPYKEPMSHEAALNIMTKEVGDHFDPLLFELSAEAIAKFKSVAEKYAEMEGNDLVRMKEEKSL